MKLQELIIAEMEEHHKTINESREVYLDCVEDHLRDCLPHGSGFNGDWEFDVSDDGEKVTASMTYDVMEDGSYVSYPTFTLHFKIDDMENFRLTFADDYSRYWARKHDLRSYIEDTIAECLDIEQTYPENQTKK